MPPVSPAEPAPSLTAVLAARIRGVRERFPVTGPETLIGSLSTAQVRIPLDGISREHARVGTDARGFWLEPVNLRAGLFLNGVVVVGRERLRHLDVITLGRNVDLVFLVGQAEAVRGRRPGIARAWLAREGVPAAATEELLRGETTLGRSAAADVVIDHGAVSKIHARIQRTTRQLVLQDLGSSNGTFVNGSRVRSSLLRDGDVLRLADVAEATFRVCIESGLVDSLDMRVPDLEGMAPPGAEAGAEKEGAPAAPAEPQVSTSWKTRYDYDASEMEEIARVRREAEEVRQERKRAAESREAQKPEKGARPAARPAPAPRAEAKPSAAKAPAAAKPTVKPPAEVKPTAKPPAAAAPPAASPAPVEPAPVAKPEIEVKPAKEALPVARSYEDTLVPGRAPVTAATAAAPIREVRLEGAGFTLTVKAPGAYVVGRATDAALRVDHPTVSRRHAQVVLSEDRMRCTLQHVGSSNATRLNGVEVPAPRELASGDLAQVGEVRLKVTISRG